MSSSESEDDFITYGTALEPLEEDEIPTRKPLQLEDQIVTDKQNRRRFHGAFTGGFSAGFFNTVGSLEGWTPSSFKSSKSKKQEITHHKPEDFMDEEDLSEFGIAPVVLKAKQVYTNDQKDISRSLKFNTLGTYILQDLLKPARETVGIKLLKKMGWKPGQGVGPRVNRKEKENALKIRQKTYGCQLPSGLLDEKEEVDQDSDTEWDCIEFAPSDYEPLLCEAKNNFSGLGYEGLDKRPILSSHQLRKDESIEEKSKKFGFSSQAFGVGAFEEEDEDIYAKDDMSRYDFSLGNDQSAEKNKMSGENYKSQEGVVDGFVLETKKRVRKHYPLPLVPKNFKGLRKIRRSRFDQPSPPDKANDKTEPVTNSEVRRKLIGEYDEKEQEAKKQKESLTKELISNVKINENRFKPFSSNPEKQERYENYLKLVKIGQKERLSDLQPLSMTTWDREREVVEFEKTALLFQPLTGGMEDRFLTASQPDDLTDPLAVVEKSKDENDDRRKAVAMNMFGSLTRRTLEWFPSAALCKGFNIRQIKEERSVNRKRKEKERISEKFFSKMFDVEKKEEKIEHVEQVPKLEKAKEKTENVEQVMKFEKAKEEAEHVEQLKKYEKEKENDTKIIEPSNQILSEQDKTDLFKAIFLDSDDETSNNEEAAEAERSKEDQITTVSGARDQFQDDLLFEDRLINSKRNLSPPSGIFKDIDLELLSANKRFKEDTENSKKIKSVVETVEANSLSSDLVYGPKIPEKIPTKTSLLTGEHFKDDGVWVEKKLSVKKSSKSKSKKHKKSVHKSKHKHKKHKR